MNKFRVRIKQDTYGEGPREWDNLGEMVCDHGEFSLGDRSFDTTLYNSWEEAIAGETDKNGVVLPLYLYNHGVLSMNTTGYHCRWDSGMVGFVHVGADRIREEYGVKRISQKIKEKVKNILRAEVQTYDQYLTGDVYGYIIEELNIDLYNDYKEDGLDDDQILDLFEDDIYEEIDSCWGYYGLDEVKEGAKEMLDKEYHYIVDGLSWEDIEY